MITHQGQLTFLAGALCMAIPFFFTVWLAFKNTPRRAFACPNCDADVPPTAVNCPKCGQPMPDQEQLI